MNNGLHFRCLRFAFVSKVCILVYTDNLASSIIMRSLSSRKIIYYFICNSGLFIVKIPIYSRHYKL
nr:MAG TPA: hypothetical protein [Caudoviricetes sp.]